MEISRITIEVLPNDANGKIEIIAINGTDEHGREVRMALENPAVLQDFVTINGRIQNADALHFTDETNEA